MVQNSGKGRTDKRRGASREKAAMRGRQPARKHSKDNAMTRNMRCLRGNRGRRQAVMRFPYSGKGWAEKRLDASREKAAMCGRQPARNHSKDNAMTRNMRCLRGNRGRRQAAMRFPYGWWRKAGLFGSLEI